MPGKPVRFYRLCNEAILEDVLLYLYQRLIKFTLTFIEYKSAPYQGSFFFECYTALNLNI